MKKTYLTVALVLTLGISMLSSSCIGKFALTSKVMAWNKQVGSKFINEVVFFAFWLLPVYEVTALADMIVINSIEFWSGNNPVLASERVIEGESGRYLVKCDGKGYDIISENDGSVVRLDFDADTQTWSVVNDGEQYPFMTMIDADHVKMVTADGDFRMVELSEQGLQAYIAGVTPLMAKR